VTEPGAAVDGGGAKRGSDGGPVVIRIDRLTKRYGPLVAVNGLSFDVSAGETFALIGPNGAGKTTTLKVLLGLTRPTSGSASVGARLLPPHDAHARHDLGYVPQRVEFPAGRTVLEVLRFFADLRDLPRQAVDRALERVRLTEHAKRRASDLSGGYTQRLSLGQALLGDPSLLILDEPTASLDPEATWEFRTLIEQLQREGKTILLSSHLLSEVERIADRVLILVEGRQAALERIADLRARQVRASRLLIELGEGRVDAGEVLRRSGLRFERVGARELIVEASNGKGLEALETLRDAGVVLRSFELQGPTLEEMFLNVVRGGKTE
jgi:ABC-type multidrug transport system ATPase subunit